MILYICQTLDGFIADEKFKFDFLDPINEQVLNSNNELIKNSYENFIKDIDIIVQGYTTYQSLIDIGMNNPYQDYENYVITKKHLNHQDETVTKFLDFAMFKQLNFTNKKVWLVGGSQIIKKAMEEAMIEEMIIFQLPIFLTKGIKLFDTVSTSKTITLKSVIHDDQFSQSHYLLK